MKPSSAPNSQPSDVDRLRRQLSMIPSASAAIRRTFGADNVQHILYVLTSKEALEVDLLVATGELTESEGLQYMRVLPEFEELYRCLTEYTSAAVQHLVPQIPRLLERWEQGEKKETIPTAFHTMEMLHNLCLVSQPSLRNTLGLMLLQQMHGEFTAAVDAQVHTSKQHGLWSNFLGALNQGSMVEFGVPFIGQTFLASRRSYSAALKDPFLRTFLDNGLAEGLQGQTIPEDYGPLLEKLKDLRQYRHIPFTSKAFEELEMSLSLDEGLGGIKTESVAIIQFSLDPAVFLTRPKLQKSINGLLTYDYEPIDGVWSFVLNAFTGELCYATNPSIPITDFIDKKRYAQLKALSYIVLDEYLESKEPDIEDLLLPSVGTVQTEVQESVQDTLESVEQELPPAQKHIHTLLQQIKNLKDQHLYRTLIRIMGEPVRISGSHHIFRSPYNNKTFPIPLHFSAESSVKFPLLRACLQHWQISLEEFCAAL